MNKLDVNQVGGFPPTTRILDELQKAFAVFNSLGALAGDKTIIAGCTVVGSTVSNGVVYVNGEVFEFRGGNTQTKVIIKEDAENLVFENNESKTVIRTRYVTFGTGVGAMDWVDFKRGFETKNIDSLVNRLEALEARPLVGNIPIGLIALWGRPANEIPAGWQEYTDLSGRIPVGFKSTDTDFDVVGKVGGLKMKKLTINELPRHRLPIPGDVNENNESGPFAIAGGTENNRTAYTDYIGGDQEFSMMNPFRVVHFIKYIG